MYGSILIVDDNPAILTALKICLEDTFEKIVTLSKPDSIMATIEAEAPELVLLDMNFSLGTNTGQDGLTWLRAIVKLHAEVPVVLMTAYADVQLAVKGMKIGAADFITKPWDNDELLRKLKDVVDKNHNIKPLAELEMEHVNMVVERCKGNISEAAKLLGVTRQTLYAKLKASPNPSNRRGA